MPSQSKGQPSWPLQACLTQGQACNEACTGGGGMHQSQRQFCMHKFPPRRWIGPTLMEHSLQSMQSLTNLCLGACQGPDPQKLSLKSLSKYTASRHPFRGQHHASLPRMAQPSDLHCSAPLQEHSNSRLTVMLRSRLYDRESMKWPPRLKSGRTLIALKMP